MRRTPSVDPSNQAVMTMARDPRLRFHLQPQGAVWYHHEAANSHVLIDPHVPERARGPGFVRPIELWRAARWKHPPSANVVRYAGSEVSRNGRPKAEWDGDEPPGAGDVINRSSVVDFVSDVSAFRLGALGALIDAVAAALDGGRPVVLAAPDADQGALWIGAVSFFASPAICLRLSFSTHERWDDVLAQLDQDASDDPTDASDRADGAAEGWRLPLLSVVPQADVEHLTRYDALPVVVLDPRIEPTQVSVEGIEYRRTHLGQRIAVTDWSRQALAACGEGYVALERSLRQLDEPSRASGASQSDVDVIDRAVRLVPADSVVEPLWLRLRAVMAGPPGRTETVRATFENYLRAALEDEQWLLRRAPPLPLGVPGSVLADTGLPGRLRGPLAGLVHRLTGDLPTVADPPTDPAADRPATLPADRPVDVPAEGSADLPAAGSTASPADRPADRGPSADPKRLGAFEPWGAFEPAGVFGRSGASGRSGVEPTGAREAPANEPPTDQELAADLRRGVQLLRGLDLAHRIARLIGGPDLAEVGIGRLADRAAELLLDPTVGPRAAELAGTLDGEALAQWLVPRLDRESESWPRSAHPVGDRLPAPVAALLAGAIDPVPLITTAQPEPLAGEPVALEVAVATATGRIAGDPRLRGPAVEYLLNRAARIYPDADPGPMVTEVFARLVPDEPWSALALLRLVERAPATLGAELVPIVLRQLPHWADDPGSARLAGALLKRIEFLPGLGADGRVRPRRAGVTDDQAQLLNLLAASGVDHLAVDDGLHRQASEILIWGERLWDDADPQIRRLIAPRITVAAFQVALAAEPDLAGTELGARMWAVPIGSSWRAALTIGLEPALPMLAEILKLNRYRLSGELVVAATRGLLNPAADLVVDAAGELLPDRPRVRMLPVQPVIHWLVRHEEVPELRGHLAALVEQELHYHVGPGNRTDVIAYWKPALLDVPFRTGGPTGPPMPPSMLDEVLQVAFGFRDGAGRPVRPGPLAGLLPWPGRRSEPASSKSSSAPGGSRPRWWPRRDGGGR
jgi:hypothetical protein